ncbi:hypothetical protein JTE90_008655 [Oedothorax gibbosus]|uniref:Uncharacterized protein n=1 Tax=Oedothorax gibbosus TaxID=931172 RepID=A0AAV6U0G5_9ARAC|nr:hypothetical protein JTE90_008655 [Oedothorax gibbosus]
MSSPPSAVGSIAGSEKAGSSALSPPAVVHDMPTRSGASAPPTFTNVRVVSPQCPTPSITDIYNDNSPREICSFMLAWAADNDYEIAMLKKLTDQLNHLGPHQTRNREKAKSDFNMHLAILARFREKLDFVKTCPVQGCKVDHSWNTTDYQVSMVPAVRSSPPPPPR